MEENPLMHALTGLSAEECTNLLPEFEKQWLKFRQQEYEIKPDQECRPGGGRKGCTMTIAVKLFFILLK
jgi:hypothetical protein